MDPREYLTTRHIVEAEFETLPQIPKANREGAIHRIEVAVEILVYQCSFTDADLYQLISDWKKESDLRRSVNLITLKNRLREKYLKGFVEYSTDQDGSFEPSAANFERAREALAELGKGLNRLPPLQTEHQFSYFVDRVRELSKHQERGLEIHFRYETGRIDDALLDILEAFTQLEGREPSHLDLENDRGVANKESVQRSDNADKGAYTHPNKPARSAVVSNVMERGDEIAKSAAESVQAMRIVLSVLEERRSNDPAESELKEQLTLLIEKIEETRAATEKAAETGAIEDAVVAAETIEKSKTVWDAAVRRIVDIGLNSAGAISCFAVALGATATFAAAGFAIPPLAALTVSAGFFGVSALMDNLPGQKE